MARGSLVAIVGTVLIAASLTLPATVGPVQGASAAPGGIQISVVVDDPSGGYIGGSSKTFSGSYDCGAGYSGTFNTLTTATPVTIINIPESLICTVTANTPTGGLLNASFSWGSTTSSAQPVTIGDATTSTIQFTHHVVQSFGTVELTKVVSGPGGYIGGGSRVFPVSYACTLTNGPSVSGAVDLTTAAPAQILAIAAGSICTFTEALSTQPGDFNDPASAWTGTTFSPASATIPAGAPAPVTVTNSYIAPFGQLTIDNTVDGTGYIGTGAPFLFDYVCGADSGQIAVAANSTASATVRAGVACTVNQQTPSAALLATGYTWGSPAWNTPNTITLPNGGSVVLVITNPIVAPAATGGEGLAATGGNLSPLAPWLALGMLAAGGVTVLVTRRRTTRRRQSVQSIPR